MNQSSAQPSFHRHSVGALVFVVAITTFVIAGTASAALAEILLRDGAVALAWVGACIGYGIWLVPRPAGDERVSRALVLSTAFAFGAGIISLLVLSTGLAGFVSQSMGWAIVAGGLAAGFTRLALKTGDRLAGWRSISVSGWSWLWLIAAPAIAALLIGPAVLPGVLWGDEPNAYDVVSYHLQVPREWFDQGSITQLPHNVFSTFPFLAEMQFLLSMELRGGAYAGMYVAQYTSAAFAAFMVLAVYGALGGGARPQAVIGAIASLVVPWTVMLGSIAYNEAPLMLYTALAIAWLVRTIDFDTTVAQSVAGIRRFAPSAVAGAMAGFACGVKYTAIPMVVLATAVAVVLLRPRQWKHNLVFIAVSLLLASPWLIRNAVWTGNPVFPLATAQFGGRDWSPQQADRFAVAHAPRLDQQSMGARLGAFKVQVITDFKYGYALIPIAVIALLIPVREMRLLQCMAAIVLGLQIVLWMTTTHLQGRFLMQSIPLMAMLIGAAATRWQGRIIGVSATLVCSATLLGVFKSAGGEESERAIPSDVVPRLADDRIRTLIGLTNPLDLWALHPPEIAEQLRESSQPIVLVGDAQAFLWPVDSKRLHYRTVFDVHVQPGETVVDAWKRGAPADAAVVIDPSQLSRLTATYRGLGNLPPSIASAPEPFIQR